MDIDTPAAGAGGPSLSVSRALRDTATELSSIISSFRPTKLFARDAKNKSPTYILSLDFDDPGELCMTSESDDTIQIYNVKEGRHDKALISKKYGAKLARFTHWSNSIVYASTKQNDSIRYLATHDNSFIRYFEGHEASVTSISMHPGTDNFVSTSQDGTVRLWNVASKQWTGLLYLNKPYLSAWDPSGNVFAVASPAAGTVLLYDHRNYQKPPFSVFDVVEQCAAVDQRNLLQGWTKLDISNDGKHILVGTRGAGHFLLDAFDGKLKAFLRKTDDPTRRAAAGEGGDVPSASGAPADPTRLEGSGDCCFTPDGRYVLGGTKQNVMVWDTLGSVGENKVLNPAFVLEDKREAAVVAFNPRFNFFATADQALVFWLPDANA
ncbi:COMPASS component SWD2 [Sporothrix brasiliensis 5110]|uniref:COMPASS component SWD2 n=1 Tax=Sporothrix brasiliensis 5110 TaxID=1398154 RepID=A0A0C2F476_9PEZI|nr:COMPASS component SWD2 [Sporothrix brasiliensis 5110]KIH93704.1 COMPASS component SWD2 [Sporothrix brasiliensis 5110]